MSLRKSGFCNFKLANQNRHTYMGKTNMSGLQIESHTDACIERAADFAQPILRHSRQIVQTNRPGVTRLYAGCTSVARSYQPEIICPPYRAGLTSLAIACSATPGSATNPFATPSRSARGRFWLTFHLPWMLAMGISIPTTAPIMV